MRKSLVMLVLMTLIVTSFVSVIGPVSGIDDGAVSEPETMENEVEVRSFTPDIAVEERPDEMDNDLKISEPEISRYVAEEPELERFETTPITIFGGESEGRRIPDLEGDGSDPTRGAVKTDTLMVIQNIPKKVYYNERIDFEGLLIEDNNSDGQRSGGDLPIEREWVELLWNDGSPFMFQADLMTEYDSEEDNMTAGRFSMPSSFLGNETNPVYLWANETSIAANGDRGVEMVLSYSGVWTADGATFYNLTQVVYQGKTAGEILAGKTIGYDDDGDKDELQNNGIDDDNDGVVDDGRAGIPAVDFPEGVDEERLNGLDDDGDGRIDEDTNAFIARTGYEKRMYIEIWHKTKTTIKVEGSDLIDVGEKFTVSGTIEDTSYEDTRMGAKTMWLFWDGQPKAKTTAQPSSSGYHSEYTFTVTVPLDETAGPHTVRVEFSPAFNLTNNYYWDPSNATTTIHVRRPTKIIFDDVDPNYGVTWVYRGSRIYINGSIVDKYLHERWYTQVGPSLSIGGVDYGNQYRFNVMWGDPIQPFAKLWAGQFIMDENGTFSIEYELPAGNQPLGPVTVTVETNFDQQRFHDPLIYYSNSENSTQFIVRATSRLEVWIDQNQNGQDDETETTPTGDPLNTFITRKPYTGPGGEQRDWNYARIRGVLKDMTQSSGSLIVGVPNQELHLWWGYGKSWGLAKQTVQTDANGRFEVNLRIDPNHPLGPVPLRITFPADYFSNYYDSDTYTDSDGQPFSVVSFTTLSINATNGIKGKNARFTGTLLDDRGVGVGNRTVHLWRLDVWTGNYQVLENIQEVGTKIGSPTTNSIGKYTFSEFEITASMRVGKVWIVAIYGGSEEFPEQNGRKGSVRYLPNDAYMGSTSEAKQWTITAETHIAIDSVDGRLIRNDEARITGTLMESFKGQPAEGKGVGDEVVTAFFKQGDAEFNMGTAKTMQDEDLPELDGYFMIKTNNVPVDLEVGNVEIIVRYAPDPYSEETPLYLSSTNTTQSEVWSSTRIEEVFFGPEDVDAPKDRRPDLFDNKPSEWVFTFQVQEGSSREAQGEPIKFGVVYLNITMGSFTNTTRAITDVRGRVTFNFTSKFRDTATGTEFKFQVDQDATDMNITVKFQGKQGYEESVKVYPCTYHHVTPTQPPFKILGVEVSLPLVLFVIFIILAIAGTALYFFYKYIEKRRRLKSLKKIIKKAADQLETGNPYSAVIFKAYQKMGAHLRRYGFMRRDADTFREFEDAVRAALPIDERSMDQFLDILEEARYSKHVIGAGHKDRAIGCLRGVEKSLDNIILDEEAALRQMELADEDYVETEIIESKKGA